MLARMELAASRSGKLPIGYTRAIVYPLDNCRIVTRREGGDHEQARVHPGSQSGGLNLRNLISGNHAADLRRLPIIIHPNGGIGIVELQPRVSRWIRNSESSREGPAARISTLFGAPPCTMKPAISRFARSLPVDESKCLGVAGLGVGVGEADGVGDGVGVIGVPVAVAVAVAVGVGLAGVPVAVAVAVGVGEPRGAVKLSCPLLFSVNEPSSVEGLSLA